VQTSELSLVGVVGLGLVSVSSAHERHIHEVGGQVVHSCVLVPRLHRQDVVDYVGLGQRAVELPKLLSKLLCVCRTETTNTMIITTIMMIR
jgi:hypothetical protein